MEITLILVALGVIFQAAQFGLQLVELRKNRREKLVKKDSE
jgi:hypothetical protein